ncbi:MAG: aminotransferase class I/II-fold pyridoxal phosphate-dependent enzyme, partial [Sphaerochaetaceae bacterium]|nr:aminotransferase class I/II-fold pyridoxal phosphate-dependent enzyme [Sphaerochaetaceae bacterium]
MNILATQLNENFKDSTIFDLFSEYGKRIYVPKGIIVQASQAKKKASKYNATIGIATTHSKPMYIDSIKDQFSNNFLSSELFSYSPMGGNAELRDLWEKEMTRKNPSMKDCLTSKPIVTSGLTNGLCIASSLFLDKDDSMVIPDMYWENYDLIFQERYQAKLVKYPLFNQNKFNCKGLSKAIENVKTDKVFVMLNFPNNPTGYSPTEKEAQEICE